MSKNNADVASNNFIRTIIKNDLQNKTHEQVITRFPPEPNGFLHLGHVKSICLNFGIAKEFLGKCYLRFDDTNPTAEEQLYIDNIKKDVRWLGFEWDDVAYYTSSYFEQLYAWAVQLIKQGDAYVDLQTPEQIKQNRGGFGVDGTDSPQRNASVDENLARFLAMKNGEYAEGEAVLRAKIDMKNPNMNLRDPVLYRVMHQSHHQTGNTWCIYPMYDYAHPLSDAIEHITHSICTLEFEDHRAFYDWVIEKIGFDVPPKQYEFARLNVDYILTSKRKLKQLVDEKIVDGWDDPRMPTIAGMRRRGYTPRGLQDFCERIGVSKADGVVDFALLEFSIRNDLEAHTDRAMVVLDPLKVTITNFDEAITDVENLKKPSVKIERTDDALWLFAPKNTNATHDDDFRKIAFSKTIYIDKSDYAQNPPDGYKRLSPNKNEIRLRNSYILKIEDVLLDDHGKVCELIASVDPKTLGNNPEGRKVRGVIHWVSEKYSHPCVVRLYDHLFCQKDPTLLDLNSADVLNPNSCITKHAVAEYALKDAKKGERFQFEREGFFIADEKEHDDNHLVFNRIVGLKDGFK